MYTNYDIKENDTLDSISIKFNTTPQVLMELNGINFKIIPGTTILVPNDSGNYFDYYNVTNGDTLYKIAMENNINANLLAALNGLKEDDYIYPNQVLIIPKPGSKLYITAYGDTLMEVVKGLNANINALMEQNRHIYLQPEQLIVYKYR